MLRFIRTFEHTLLVFCVVLCACSAYDPKLVTFHGHSGDAGADLVSDAEGRVDAARDAELPRQEDAGPDAGHDATLQEDCKPNPDRANLNCPEICPEVCNGQDDDCDGRSDESDADRSCAAPHSNTVCETGECYVTQCAMGYRDCDQLALTGCEVAPDDIHHCGGCGSQCAIADATSVCRAGKCLVKECNAGFADCNADGVSCETRTNTLTNCGACSASCHDVPNAVPSCATGSCGVGACKAGFGDCDLRADDGCEQRVDTLQHCGGCNTPCNKASCGGGVCTAADCSKTPGHADCDRDEASCETDLRSDLNNCGACGYKCQFTGGVAPHASLACTVSGCVATCAAGYGDCDGNYANGCEQPLDTLEHCGACRMACSISNANATCSTGSCQVGSCASDYADCDNDKKSCETQLNTPDHCGACNSVCSLPNAVEGCGGSAGAHSCTVTGCDANWADCDGSASNGCERDVRAVGSGGLGPCLPDNGCRKSNNGQNEYYVCSTARTWSDARSRCQLQANGDLATVVSASEGDFLKTKLSATSWIGANDSAHEGQWVWASNQVPFWQGGAINGLYSSWAPGEPNASGNCGELSASGQFDDAACSSSLPFVCKVAPDGCPSDASKRDPGQCGCGNPDTDTDGDGYANCNDSCPSDANKRLTGVCGCGVADLDSDADGTANCHDGCPNDAGKIAAGVCGCGTPDADSDGDGTLNCNDGCPSDANKTSPGACGCGVADSNSDGDAAADCNDGCPYDATTTGACFSFGQTNFSATPLNFAASPSSTLNCGGTITINTSNAVGSMISNWCGTLPTPVIQNQSGGPSVVVIPLRGLTLATGNTLRLIGSRPVVFAVRGNVTVDGVIDASASGNTPGAGGDWSCGGSAGGNGSGSALLYLGGGGGGGGGFGTAGGRGGEGNSDPTTYGSVGAARNDANLSPLHGGCPGGVGGGCSAAGGAGGGAVQITASGALDINGTIRANGGNGANGCSTEGGGAGGGSGGAIFLEGASRDTTGSTITVNGGMGGDGTGLLNGAGANGSSSSGNAGGSGNNASGAGGGGGGGYGRIRLRP